MSALTPEKLAELRRLLDATETPWALWDGYGPDGNGDMRVARIGHLSGSGIRADPDSADIYGMREAFELLASAVNALPALLDAAAERDALRTWQERVALAAGLADEVAGYGVHLEADPDTAAEHVAGLLDIADTHAECPIYCGDCGELLADTPCDHCGGSGCGPGTGSWAYEECGWCAGAGKVHVGCAHLSYAELCAERDALAAKLDADGQPVVHSDVEPHGSTPRKPLVIESVSSTLRIEGRQEPLGPAYLVMSADDDWGDSVRIDLGIQDARLLSGWLGSWLRNKA